MLHSGGHFLDNIKEIKIDIVSSQTCANGEGNTPIPKILEETSDNG
jgi:hypothetical protein